MMQPSMLRPTYLPCRHPAHLGQVLNYICLHRSCQNHGLICSLCKQEHKSHSQSIMPLKYLLQALRGHVQIPMETTDFEGHLQQIENIKNELLYGLRVTVQSIANAFKALEERIFDSFKSTKMELLEQIQLNMNFSHIIQNAGRPHLDFEEEYVANMRKIAEAASIVEGGSLKFQINLDSIVKKYARKKERIQSILEKVDTWCIDMLGKDLQFQKDKDLLASIPSLPEKNVEKVLPKLKYTFSNTFKALTIVLTPDLLTARQSSTASTRFVCVEEGVGVKNQSITFRIKRLINWIGLGVCVRQKIQAVGYLFKYEALGHGSYLVSNNGYTWSHSHSEDNIKTCLFTFKEGALIDITANQKELTYVVRDTGLTFKLKISFTEQEWKGVCFCANLCSNDDSVEIVNIV